MGVRRSAKRINPSVAPLRGQRTHDTILTRAVSRPVPLPVGDQCKIGTMIADWRTEAQRYELRDIGSGNWAYMLKPEERGSEYPAWLCPTCFAQGLKGGFYSSLPSSAARDRSTAAVNARATRWCRANRTGFEARNIDADLRDFNCCRPAPVRLAECSPPERITPPQVARRGTWYTPRSESEIGAAHRIEQCWAWRSPTGAWASTSIPHR